MELGSSTSPETMSEEGSSSSAVTPAYSAFRAEAGLEVSRLVSELISEAARGLVVDTLGVLATAFLNLAGASGLESRLPSIWLCRGERRLTTIWKPSASSTRRRRGGWFRAPIGAESIGGLGSRRASCLSSSERSARRAMNSLWPFLGEEVFFISIYG